MCSLPVSTLRVAAIPFTARAGDARDNVARIVAALERAAGQGVKLAVFPESCVSGAIGGMRQRRPELDAIAEPLEGPSIGEIARAVDRTGVAVGVGWLERAADGRLFNSYAVCLPGGRRACHRKLSSSGHRSIASGDSFTIFDTGWGIRAGILIGADNHASENARMTALMGATLLIAPHRCCDQAAQTDRGANTIELLGRTLPGRALDNGTFVVFNGGADDGGDRASPRGAAMIVDPLGRVVADHMRPAGASDPFICAELDLALTQANVGQQWFAARRPALYRALAGAAEQPFAPPERRTVTSRGAIALSFAVVRRTASTP